MFCSTVVITGSNSLQRKYTNTQTSKTDNEESVQLITFSNYFIAHNLLCFYSVAVYQLIYWLTETKIKTVSHCFSYRLSSLSAVKWAW